MVCVAVALGVLVAVVAFVCLFVYLLCILISIQSVSSVPDFFFFSFLFSPFFWSTSDYLLLYIVSSTVRNVHLFGTCLIYNSLH